MPDPHVPHPYQNRIHNIQDRLHDLRGGHKDTRQQLHGTLQRLRAKGYYQAQNNRPETPPPWSAIYDSTVGNLQNNLNQTNADIAGRQLATEQQYGFGADQSDPFSIAAMLRNDYEKRQATTNTSYAGHGQLYSGALSAAQGQNRLGMEQGMDTQMRAYQAALANLAQQRIGAQNTYQSGVLQAEADRLEAGLNHRPEPSEAPRTPHNVQHFLKGLQRRAQSLQRHGKGHKAQQVRRRITRVKGR